MGGRQRDMATALGRDGAILGAAGESALKFPEQDTAPFSRHANP